MNRREFLSRTAFAAVVVAVRPEVGSSAASPTTPKTKPVSGGRSSEVNTASTAVFYGNRHFLALPGGEILVSDDGTKTWNVHTSFGPDQNVRSLSLDRGRLKVLLETKQSGTAAHPFSLTLGRDHKFWFSSGSPEARVALA